VERTVKRVKRFKQTDSIKNRVKPGRAISPDKTLETFYCPLSKIRTILFAMSHNNKTKRLKKISSV